MIVCLQYFQSIFVQVLCFSIESWKLFILQRATLFNAKSPQLFNDYQHGVTTRVLNTSDKQSPPTNHRRHPSHTGSFPLLSPISIAFSMDALSRLRLSKNSVEENTRSYIGPYLLLVFFHCLLVCSSFFRDSHIYCFISFRSSLFSFFF